MTERVYFDHAATTALRPEVLEAMMGPLTTDYGNANALYTEGRNAARALEAARERIAKGIGAEFASEVIFTSGGTEADNAALQGIMDRVAPDRQGHVITSAFEHHAVLDPAERLRKQGYEVTILYPRSDGFVHPEDLADALRDDTKLVSIMYANNELGTIQPIKELAAIAHERGAYFHTDAVQALGKIHVDVVDLGVDAASFSAHKLHGPKGFGALYLKRRTPFAPQILGGGQENRRRSGTQNLAGAVGFATAIELAIEEIDSEAERLVALRDSLISQITERLENTEATVSEGPRLPGVAPLLIKGVEGESMLLQLDNQGFSVSTGSACSSGSLEPSHVLLCVGVPQEIAHGSLRVSMGRENTQEQVDAFVEALVPIVERLRAMSPVYERMFKNQ